jgi:hypothetical protein
MSTSSFVTSTSSFFPFAALVFVSSSALTAMGCAPQQACPPPAAATTSAGGSSTRLPGTGERHVYRFDFALTANDGAAPPSSTSFTLVLQEAEKGEVVVGKNVSLSTAGPPGSGPMMAVARQDVGVKVAALFRAAPGSDDVVLEVSTEMSAFEPPTTVRKVVAKGNALATSGKSALVTTLEDDHKKYQLTVTPTKLR